MRGYYGNTLIGRHDASPSTIDPTGALSDTEVKSGGIGAIVGLVIGIILGSKLTFHTPVRRRH